jgi:hypothetical protein
VRASGLSIARGEAIPFDDHRVPPPYVDAGALLIVGEFIWRRPRKFVVDNFPLSISNDRLSYSINIPHRFDAVDDQRWSIFTSALTDT